MIFILLLSTLAIDRQAGLDLLRRGITAYQEFRLADAEPLIRRATELLEGDEYAYALASLGVVLAAKGENARAEPVLRRAIALLPNVPELELDLALVHLRQGEFRIAERLLLRSEPRAAAAALAELYIAERRWQDAEIQIARAVAYTIPEQIGLLHLKALLKAHSRDNPSAITDLQQAIEMLEQITGPHSSALLPLLETYFEVLHASHLKSEAKQVRQRARRIRQKQAALQLELPEPP